MGDTVLSGERHVLELIATGASLTAVLDAICALIEAAPRVLASIYLLGPDGQTLSFGAGPHIPEPWRVVSSSFRVTATTTGACGAALSGRTPVVVDDIQSSPLYWPDWRDAARASGIVGSWSTPFFASNGRALGTFVLVSRAVWRPSDEQPRAVARAAYLAGIATELNESVSRLRALSGRLMRAQDDERRRIAQMLHETTAQDLAALKMQLASLVRSEPAMSEQSRATVKESVELAERSMENIRTLSYLLHPPFLDEAGLLSALRWYSEGFSKRSGIRVDLDLPQTLPRFGQEVETALFRVVQEALINVHRHAGSPDAAIRLHLRDSELTLEVEDHGRGISSGPLDQLPAGGGALGVGVAGMRERLQQLGGALDIESAAPGTIVRARVPVAGAAS